MPEHADRKPTLRPIDTLFSMPLSPTKLTLITGQINRANGLDLAAASSAIDITEQIRKKVRQRLQAS